MGTDFPFNLTIIIKEEQRINLSLYMPCRNIWGSGGTAPYILKLSTSWR